MRQDLVYAVYRERMIDAQQRHLPAFRAEMGSALIRGGSVQMPTKNFPGSRGGAGESM